MFWWCSFELFSCFKMYSNHVHGEKRVVSSPMKKKEKKDGIRWNETFSSYELDWRASCPEGISRDFATRNRSLLWGRGAGRQTHLPMGGLQRYNTETTQRIHGSKTVTEHTQNGKWAKIHIGKFKELFIAVTRSLTPWGGNQRKSFLSSLSLSFSDLMVPV